MNEYLQTLKNGINNISGVAEGWSNLVKDKLGVLPSREKEVVEKIAKPSNDILCGVCLDEIKTGKKLRCGHIFHLRCIK